MKIIKSFFLVTISLCTTTLLHAQDVKAEVIKTVEPKQSSADNRPSPVPVLKPQNTSVITDEAKATENFIKEETKSKIPEPKVELKTIDADAGKNKLSAEAQKTFNGNSEKQKEIILMPNSNDQRPVPTTKPAVSKEQQKQ